MAGQHYDRSIRDRIMESRFSGGRTFNYGLHNHIKYESGNILTQADLAGGMSTTKTWSSYAHVTTSSSLPCRMEPFAS